MPIPGNTRSLWTAIYLPAEMPMQHPLSPRTTSGCTSKLAITSL
jgi:hypothetical protein